MAENTGISMPAGFGGLTRYNEEYDSKIKISPEGVIVMIIAVLGLVVGLRILGG